MALSTPSDLALRLRDTPMEEFRGYFRLSFISMNTQQEITFAAASVSRARAFRDAALSFLADFEATYSAHRPDSLISRINAAAGRDWVAIGSETEALLDLCDALHWRTRGLFDPTIGPLLKLWAAAARAGAPPAPEAVRDARAWVAWPRIQRRPGFVLLAEGMSLDLGGLGKEYAVDRVVDLARRHGLVHLLVNLGRDVRAMGQPPEGGPWRIGLERPDRPGHCWNGVPLENEALCCSGDYVRGFTWQGRRLSHILDPRTGYPCNHALRAAWVVAPTATEAGLLTTSALIAGPEEGLALIRQAPPAEGCLWSDAGLYITGGFERHVMDRSRLSA